MATTNSDKASRPSIPGEDLLRLLDTMPALIHNALPDGSVDFLNRGWLDFVGLALEDMHGRRWTDTFHPQTRKAISRADYVIWVRSLS
jgi:PAS domain-containing protein